MSLMQGSQQEQHFHATQSALYGLREELARAQDVARIESEAK